MHYLSRNGHGGNSAAVRTGFITFYWLLLQNSNENANLCLQFGWMQTIRVLGRASWPDATASKYLYALDIAGDYLTFIIL